MSLWGFFCAVLGGVITVIVVATVLVFFVIATLPVMSRLLDLWESRVDQFFDGK